MGWVGTSISMGTDSGGMGEFLIGSRPIPAASCNTMKCGEFKEKVSFNKT